jgi:hypothetical protein
MRAATAVCLLLLMCAPLAAPAQSVVFESMRAAQDTPLNTDPTLPFWRDTPTVYAERGNFSERNEQHRTEIRSRWTEKYLYFLFVCPYQELNLNPSPHRATETFQLWDWDVAEVFLGSDFQNIRRYKEFEISPQDEWVDLDIDLAKPHHEDGWVWNSGFDVAARIDTKAKIWYGAMRIPFTALQSSRPSTGQIFRINLYRIEGAEPRQTAVMWKPTMQKTFHVPESFGQLRLRGLGP